MDEMLSIWTKHHKEVIGSVVWMSDQLWTDSWQLCCHGVLELHIHMCSCHCKTQEQRVDWDHDKHHKELIGSAFHLGEWFGCELIVGPMICEREISLHSHEVEGPMWIGHMTWEAIAFNFIALSNFQGHIPCAPIKTIHMIWNHLYWTWNHW